MTTYYYFDLLGERKWASARIDGQECKPLDSCQVVNPDDVIFAHLSDLQFANKRAFVAKAKVRLSINNKEANALNTKREAALDILNNAAEQPQKSSHQQSQSGGGKWYFYSGGSGGAKAACNANNCEQHKFLDPARCGWVVLTEPALNERAQLTAIDAWVKEQLAPSQPHVEKMERLFRLFLDTELFLFHREKGGLPEKLKSLQDLPESKLAPDWNRYFETATRLAKERGKEGDWPFTLFSDDIRKIAVAFRDKKAFDQEIESLKSFEELWIKRFSETPS